MAKFNHAFTIAFEVISDTGDGEDVTNEMLMAACLERLSRLAQGKIGPEGADMRDACDAPYDTYEVKEA